MLNSWGKKKMRKAQIKCICFGSCISEMERRQFQCARKRVHPHRCSACKLSLTSLWSLLGSGWPPWKTKLLVWLSFKEPVLKCLKKKFSKARRRADTCLSATTGLILGFKAAFKLSGGNNWVEICCKYCASILSRNTDNQSLAWKLWITKCTRANGSFIGSEIHMKGQACRWPCGDGITMGGAGGRLSSLDVQHPPLGVTWPHTAIYSEYSVMLWFRKYGSDALKDETWQTWLEQSAKRGTEQPVTAQGSYHTHVHTALHTRGACDKLSVNFNIKIFLMLKRLLKTFPLLKKIQSYICLNIK